MSLPVLDERRRATKFIELPVRSIINPPESTGMGFWSVNPYVGCEFGCTYCYARYAHRYVVERARDADRIVESDLDDFGSPRGLEPFEHRVFVKSCATLLVALEHDLSRLRRRTARDGLQSVLIGSATDPYQPAERQYQVTRATLQRLLSERGFRIGIITKSPLVLRDLVLLRQLARRHVCSVYISLVSVDARVTRRFEARSPLPHARLRALEKLNAVGVRAGLLVAPVLPGITDSTARIRELMEAARRAGAQFVFPVPLRLYPDTRRRVLPIVERFLPDLAQRYRVAYGESWNAPEEYVAAMRERFHRIAIECGIPDADVESDHSGTPHRSPATQLSLW